MNGTGCRLRGDVIRYRYPAGVERHGTILTIGGERP